MEGSGQKWYRAKLEFWFTKAKIGIAGDALEWHISGVVRHGWNFIHAAF
jgi:hypothetical protein